MNEGASNIDGTINPDGGINPDGTINTDGGIRPDNTAYTAAGSSESSANVPRRVSLEQACHLVGVGQETLLRFLESGYFPGATKELGILVTDLEAIFGVRIPSQFVRHSSAKAETKLASVVESEAQAASPSTDEELSAPSAAAQDISSTDESAHYQRDSAGAEHDASSQPFSSVPRRSLIEMYERLVTQLQAENSSLRSERDWLKTRIERYEEKTSRDQLLMLSETQTIKALLDQYRITQGTLSPGNLGPANSGPANLGKVSNDWQSNEKRAQGQQAGLIKAGLQWLGLLPVAQQEPVRNKPAQRTGEVDSRSADPSSATKSSSGTGPRAP